MVFRLLTVVWIGLSLAAPVAAEDDASRYWPHWRGPLANGVAPWADPPLTWDAETHVKWKVSIPGEGHATPIVWKDRIYVLSALETTRLAETPSAEDAEARTEPPGVYYQYLVWCLSRDTGEILWSDVAVEAPPPAGRHQTNTYASGSPTTDGERLYVSFGSQGIYCYDLDGQRLWDRDLGDLRTRFGWGEATTPVVYNQRVVVNWDHEDQSFIVALSAETGETVWRQERDEPTTWATPLVIEHDGIAQVIVNGTNRARSYDLNTGDLLWECGGQTVNVIPSPIAADSDSEFVICMSGYRGAAAFAIPLAARGDITHSETILWTIDRGTPYVPSPILVDGRLYFTQANSNLLSCVDADTGAWLYGPVRLEGIDNIYASPVAAAGRIYFTGREGTTVVLRASSTFEVLATNRLGEPIDASPALVDRELLLRTASHLYCLAE